MMNKLLAVLFLLITCSFSHGALAPDDRIELAAPGEASMRARSEGELTSAAGAADWLIRERWYSVRIIGNRLFLEPVRGIRRPDWHQEHEDLAQTMGAIYGAAPDMPEGAIFALRILHESTPRALPIRAQGYPSLLPVPAVLEDKWHQKFSMGGRSWIIQTRYERRADGALLAGSMELELNVPNEGVRTFLPAANHMAYSKQELMWLGDIDQDGEPDAVLRRVWITGEQDYVVVLGGRFESVYVDEDFPVRIFSSGVEETTSILRHVSQKYPLGEAKFTSAFNVPESIWEKLGGGAERPAEPVQLADLKIDHQGESLRFSLDYLPRKSDEKNSSTVDSGSMWIGETLVRVTYRGRPQVLLQAQKPDGGLFRVEIGDLSGKTVIRISYPPHYNNSFQYYWLYSEEESRFKRVVIDQSQGC